MARLVVVSDTPGVLTLFIIRVVQLRHQVTVPWPCLTGRVLLLSRPLARALWPLGCLPGRIDGNMESLLHEKRLDLRGSAGAIRGSCIGCSFSLDLGAQQH